MGNAHDAVTGVPERTTVLLIDDDQDLNRLVVRFLEKNGFRVLTETDGARALDRVAQEQPQLIILDVMWPGTDGLSICREARAFYVGPILMLTALGDDIDEVAGLETGADDYLAKPVRPRVLLAHVRALLRRHHAITATLDKSDRIEVGELTVDAGTREVLMNDQSVRVSGAEFDLLQLLAQHAGQVLSRDTIYRHLSGRPYDGADRMVDLRISRLRKKLGDDPENPNLIKSVRSVGYLLAQ